MMTPCFPRKSTILILWTLLVVASTHVQALSNPSHASAWPRSYTSTSLHESRPTVVSRRQVCGALTAFGLAAAPLPSWALKPRNEQLCGTGLFTNFLEYRCTEIGDISDEGQRTSLSASESGAADSLMSKLNLDIEEGGDSDGASKKDDKKPSASETTSENR